MINLLPPSLKATLKKEDQARLLWILCFLVALFFFCLFLLLLSLGIYLKGSVNAKEILLDAYTQQTVSDTELKEEIRELNKTMTQLSSFYGNQQKVSGIVERVAKAVPQGIHLTSLQYVPSLRVALEDKTKIVPARIILAGFSPTRADLLLFRESLRQEPAFQNFEFPPANWSKPSDILFSFSFEISRL